MMSCKAKYINVISGGSVLLFTLLIFYEFYESLRFDYLKNVDVTVGKQKIIFDPARLRHGAADRQEEGGFRLVEKGKRIHTDIVVFVPSPVAWETRRKYVYEQFVHERLAPQQAILLFIFGNRTTTTGDDNNNNNELSTTSSVNMKGLVQYQNATNVVVNCRDYGDEYDNPDDTSGTTCKVYKSLIYIVSNYRAKYVWRGADDSYLNLRFFISGVMPTLPKTRLYYGYLRSVNAVHVDMLLSNQPKLASLFGLYQFGQYMLGGGYLLSFDVADFIASLKIPPHLTWCEDVMVGMWLNPFQVTFLHSQHYIDQGGGTASNNVDYVLIHRMRADQWSHIDENGRLQQ